MRDDEFDRRIEIRVATDGSARMDVQRD